MITVSVSWMGITCLSQVVICWIPYAPLLLLPVLWLSSLHFQVWSICRFQAAVLFLQLPCQSIVTSCIQALGLFPVKWLLDINIEQILLTTEQPRCLFSRLSFGLILYVSQLKVHGLSSPQDPTGGNIYITMPVCYVVLHIGLLKSVEVHQITLSLGKVPLGLICIDHFGTWTWPIYLYWRYP